MRIDFINRPSIRFELSKVFSRVKVTNAEDLIVYIGVYSPKTL